MSRRPDGALESDVLQVLWEANEPMPPADVLSRIELDLAYTSIATVLNRLCDKGLVTRQRAGRKYVYTPTGTEADVTAGRISRVLDAANDRQAALAGFLRTLNDADTDALRSLLDDDHE